MLSNLISSEVGGTWCFEQNTDYAGDNLDTNPFTRPSPDLCQALCQRHAECVAFTWNPSSGQCLLKSTTSFQVKESVLTSGPKFCGIQNPTYFYTWSQ